MTMKKRSLIFVALMISLLCLLLAGCDGDDYPDTPNTTSTQDTSDIPGTSAAPDTQGTPDTQDTTEATPTPSDITVSQNGVELVYAADALPAGAVMEVQMIASDSESAAEIGRKLAHTLYEPDKVLMLEIRARANGVSVQPSGRITVTVKKPFADVEDYVAFHIRSDDTVEELTPVVSGDTLTVTVDSLSPFIFAQKHTHTFAGTYSYDESNHWYASVCGHEARSGEQAHSFGDPVTVSEATEEAAGSRKRVCSACGYEQVEEIPALPHTHTFAETYTFDDTGHWRAATCGHELKESAGEHTVADGICTVCGYTEIVGTEGLIYKLNADGTAYTVSGIGTATATEIVIPPRYNGLPVTEIGENCFKNCAHITHVSIPGSVRTVSFNAFRNCKGLTRIVLPEGVERLMSNAFEACTSLTDAVLPKSLTLVGSEVFMGCSSLARVNIPEGIGSISIRVFMDCTSLESVVIPHGITGIGVDAFAGCSKLGEISLPETVTRVDARAFADCRSLRAITLPEALSSISEGILRGCSSLTSVALPDCVTQIGYNAFRDCTALASFTFPAELTTIRESAFFGCSSLTEVILKDKVQRIESQAFEQCTSVVTVVIPKTVTYIGIYAFRDCTRVDRVDITDLSAWCTINFDGEASNPMNAGAGLYVGNEPLTELVIPVGNRINGRMIVGPYTFTGCTSLKTVTVPKEIEGFGIGAFGDCVNLEAVYYAADQESWLKLQFGTDANPLICAGNLYCDGVLLTNLVLPATLTEINACAFSGASCIQTVDLTSGALKKIGREAFKGCTSIQSLFIPSNVVLERDCFTDCSSLTDLRTGTGVIGVDAHYIFTGCPITHAEVTSKIFSYVPGSKLETVTLLDLLPEADHVSILPFDNCERLYSVTLPAGAYRIIGYGFMNCKNLHYVYYGGTIAEWKNIQHDPKWTDYTGGFTVYCDDGAYHEKDRYAGY